MIETNEAPHQNLLRLLVYGESGVGKTFLIKTVPEHWKVLYIDIEKKTAPLADAKQTITRLQFTGWKDLSDNVNAIIEKAKGYDCIVVDSLTDLRAWIYNAAEMSINGGKDVIGDKHELQYWGFAVKKILLLIDRLKCVDKPIIFLGRMTLDPNNRYILDIGNKMSLEVPARLDSVVALVKNQKGERRLVLSNDRYYTRLHNENEILARYPEGLAPANLTELYFGGKS